MGMRFGVVVAKLRAAQFVTAIHAAAPSLTDLGPLSNLDAIEQPEEGAELVIGELDGWTAICDTSYLFSPSTDLFAEVARSTGATVLVAMAQTTAGEFMFCAAEGPSIRRHFYDCHGDLPSPLSMGEPFPSEAETPLDEVDGHGFWRVLEEYGFSYDAWLKPEIAKRRLLWTGEDIDGPLAKAVADYRDLHATPPGKHRKSQVIRREGGWDIATRRSLAPTRPWWRFW